MVVSISKYTFPIYDESVIIRFCYQRSSRGRKITSSMIYLVAYAKPLICMATTDIGVAPICIIFCIISHVHTLILFVIIVRGSNHFIYHSNLILGLLWPIYLIVLGSKKYWSYMFCIMICMISHKVNILNVIEPSWPSQWVAIYKRAFCASACHSSVVRW